MRPWPDCPKGRDVQTLRTRDDRFARVPDFPYTPRYCEVSDDEGGTLRVAWVQDGPESADPILMLRGEPSWSYLPRPSQRHPGGSGLGWTHRIAASRRASRTVRPSGCRQHRTAEWRAAYAVIEETLRYDPPVQMIARTAGDDMTIGSLEVPEGDIMMLLTAAAQRDPAEYDRPDGLRPRSESAARLRIWSRRALLPGCPIGQVGGRGGPVGVDGAFPERPIGQ